MFKPLATGDTVAVIAPSGWVDPARLEVAANILSEAGFTPFIHPQCHARDGRFAGDDATRLAALHEVYADPSVKAIWCARGGYGAIRLLDRLDYRLIAAHPKPLLGLSDITALLLAIHAHTGQVTFHGRMAGDMARKPCPATDAHVWRVLRGDWPAASDLAALPAQTVVPGAAEGVLLGGNLATLVSLIGSPDVPQLEGCILFLEEVGEPFYRLDRLLMQLIRANLGRPKAVIFGGMTAMEDDARNTPGWSVEGIIRHHFGALGIPVVMNFPAGHLEQQTVLPIGAQVELVAGEEVRLTVKQAVFS